LFASPPHQWNLGADASGFLCEGGRPAPATPRALVEQLRRRAGVRTWVEVGRQDAEDWAPAVPAGVYSTARTAHFLDLLGGFDRVWSSRFSGKVRSNSRKAERRGVQVESDSTGRLMPIFDQLLRLSVHRWAREKGYPLLLLRWLAARRHPLSRYRRIRIYLDDCRVADLAFGATVRIPAYDDHHQLRARCRPLSTAQVSVDLAPCQTLRLLIYVGTQDEPRICPAPTAQHL
jgi:hypothetical protein